MTWRRYVAADAESLSDTEVWDYSLGTTGILSGAVVIIKATNGSTSNVDNPIAGLVNKIEITDGARKLHSVTGIEEQALAAYDLKQVAPDTEDMNADKEQVGVFTVKFGRYLGDNDYFLDLSKLSNPKLEVDFDITNVRAAGATGFVSGSADITVILIKDDTGPFPAPKGYLRAIEQYSWTTAASGDERVALQASDAKGL